MDPGPFSSSRTRQLMNKASYFLKRNCFVCKIHGNWIVLNAETDRYLSVADADLVTIAHRVHGCRNPIPETFLPDSNDTEPPLILSLVSNGVLTMHPFEGKPFKHEIIIACTTAIDINDSPPRSRPSLLQIYRFVIACAKTDWRLRKHSLLRTMENVKRRQFVLQNGKDQHFHAITSLAAQFRSLRPLYPHPSVCLFDSIALLDFLARHKVYANLVFGVVADPFTAHCWVQHHDIALNDDIESLQRYTPILGL